MPTNNQFNVIAHAVRAAESIDTQSGKPMTKVTLAVNAGSGERKKTWFLDVLCFGGWAQNALDIEKGFLVYATGELTVELNEYQGKSYANSVLMAREIKNLSYKKSPEPRQPEQNNSYPEIDDVPF
jgi:single-stranded DNA-binding protein